MKLKDFTKRVFALGLTLSLVVTGSGISADTASAAKKPKLSKSKLTITAGKTATLSVKNANKKVKWSTSKKKVVKIGKASGAKKDKVTLQAVKKGKAVITAKVGKKKLKCKITVKKPVPNFKSVSVDNFDSKCLVLKLKKKDASIKVTDLSVVTRVESSGAYNRKINVQKVVAVNKKQYRVYLQNGVPNGEYVQITSGVSKASTQYKRPFYVVDDEVNCLVEKGETVDVNLAEEGCFGNSIGGIKFSVSKGKLPEGLTLDAKAGDIKGIPTTVGNTAVTFTAKDELGRKAKLAVNFGVYDNTAITVGNQSKEIAWGRDMKEKAAAQVAANATTFDADKNSSSYYAANYTIAPKGGSGNYTFTLDTPDNADVRLSTDEVSDDAAKTVTKKNAQSTTLRIPYSITTGTHTYKVTVTDVMDANRSCVATVTVNVVPYYNLTGIVKSSNGLPITGATVALIPSKAVPADSTVQGDRSDVAKTRVYTDVTVSKGNGSGGAEVGVYDVEVPADTYTVKVAGDVTYQMTKTVKVAKKDTIATVSVPERFYAVSANATYSNKANKLENKRVYFESLNNQYESYGGDFATTTNAEGSYNIALPANTYVSYIVDEKGNRKYFGKKFTVTNKDLVLASMQASIARYSLEGIAFNGTAVDAQTQFADKISDATLEIYNDKGICVAQPDTDERGYYKVFLEGNATYTVKVDFAGARRTLGSVTVAQDNQKDVNLTYAVATDIAGAVAYAAAPLATESILNSVGGNDLVWSFAPAETAQYNLIVSTAVNNGADVALLDSNMQLIRRTENYDVEATTQIKQTKISAALEANKTYYIKVMPYGMNDNKYDYTPQAQGEVKLAIAKAEAVLPSPSSSSAPMPTPSDNPTPSAAPTPSAQPTENQTFEGTVSSEDQGHSDNHVEIPFTVTTDGRYYIAVDSLEYYDMEMCVYNEDGVKIVLGYDEDDMEVTDAFFEDGLAGFYTPVLEAGDYTMRLIFSDYDENGDLQDYLAGSADYQFTPLDVDEQ